MNLRHFWPVFLGGTAALLPLAGHAHVHIQLGFAAADWDLHVLDFESGRFSPAEYPFVVAADARQPVPGDAKFHPFLGQTGNVWILPQTEAAGLLNLGLGTSGIPAGFFSGDQVRLRLHQMDGPGHFALFTLSPFGAPVAPLASLDGVDPAADFLVLPADNGHVHVNWAFTAAGTYRVGLQATATLASTGQAIASPVTEYLFVVEGPPAPTLGRPVARPDGTWELPVTAPAGTRFGLQFSADLGHWETLGEFTGTGHPELVALPASNAPRQFFRAVGP